MRRVADAPTRSGYHHGHLREALVEAAAELVAVRGVEGFSLREAARAVGVSPAAAYRHFADRSALLLAVATEGMGRLAAMMAQAIAKVPGPAGDAAHAVAVFVAVGEAYLEFAVRHASHFKVMFGGWCEVPPPGEKVTRAAAIPNDPFQILVERLDALVAAGAVSSEARQGAEVLAWSAVHGLASLLVGKAVELTSAERNAAMALATGNLLRGMGCTPPRLPPRPTAGGDRTRRVTRRRTGLKN